MPQYKADSMVQLLLPSLAMAAILSNLFAGVVDMMSRSTLTSLAGVCDYIVSGLVLSKRLYRLVWTIITIQK